MSLLAAIVFVFFLSSSAHSSDGEEISPKQLGIDFVCGPVELQTSFDNAYGSVRYNSNQMNNEGQQRAIVSLQYLNVFSPCETGSSSFRSLVRDHHAKIRFDTQSFKETMSHNLPTCEPHVLKTGDRIALITYIFEAADDDTSVDDCVGKIVRKLNDPEFSA